jgi:hypothetical protein
MTPGQHVDEVFEAVRCMNTDFSAAYRVMSELMVVNGLDPLDEKSRRAFAVGMVAGHGAPAYDINNAIVGLGYGMNDA